MSKRDKIKKIRREAKKKVFRLSSYNLYLTYSQCEIPLSKALEELKIILSNYEVTEYLLVREKRTEGFSLTTEINNDNLETVVDVDKRTHIHVFIETKKKMEILDLEKLDLYSGTERYHANYQSVKFLSDYTEKIIHYIFKNFFDKNYENILCSKFLLSCIKRFERDDVLTKDEKYRYTVLELEKAGILDEATKAFEQLQLYNISQQLKKPYAQQSIGLFRGPETAKSLYVYIREQLKLEPLLVHDFYEINQFICGFHKSILLYDINLSMLTRETVLKLVDSSVETTFGVETASGAIVRARRIPAKTPRFIVSSNKTLSELLGLKIDGVTLRRVAEFDIGGIENCILFEVSIKKQDS